MYTKKYSERDKSTQDELCRVFQNDFQQNTKVSIDWDTVIRKQ